MTDASDRKTMRSNRRCHGRYAEQAHKAYRDEQQSDGRIRCKNSENRLLLRFLIEVKNARLIHSQMRDDGGAGDHVLRNLKRAIKNLIEHPLRVYDKTSAMMVGGIGVAIADLIQDELFALYAPTPASDEGQDWPDGCEQVPRTCRPIRTLVASSGDDFSESENQESENFSARDTRAFDDMYLNENSSIKESNIVSQSKEPSSPKAVTTPNSRSKKTKKSQIYKPDIGTANYAFLITLLEAQKGPEGKEFLTKQELITKADASGLSDRPIASQGVSMHGPRNMARFYSGWSSFKTLVKHDLVHVYSNPKKICLKSSGLALAEKVYRIAVHSGKFDPIPGIPTEGGFIFQEEPCPCTPKSVDQKQRKRKLSRSQRSISKGCPKRETNQSFISRDPILTYASTFQEPLILRDCKDNSSSDTSCGEYAIVSDPCSTQYQDDDENCTIVCLLSSDDEDDVVPKVSQQSISSFRNSELRNCDEVRRRPISQVHNIEIARGMPGIAGDTLKNPWWVDAASLRLPPLAAHEIFSDVYDVVLIVDGREQYSRSGSQRSGTSLNNPDSGRDALKHHLLQMRNAGLLVEERQLPVGDALWVARNKYDKAKEWVLDMVIERKSLSDLVASIKHSNRYNKQKYHMKCCGLRNLYYLIEGDIETWPNVTEYKLLCSAAATTEVAHDFKILRTKSVQETFWLYRSFTQLISKFYDSMAGKRFNCSDINAKTWELPFTFTEFVSKAQQASKSCLTVKDIWGCMLLKVPGLGPEGAEAITAEYPTPLALWKEYKSQFSLGNGKERAESLLKGMKARAGGRPVSTEASRNVFTHLFAKKLMSSNPS